MISVETVLGNLRVSFQLLFKDTGSVVLGLANSQLCDALMLRPGVLRGIRDTLDIGGESCNAENRNQCLTHARYGAQPLSYHTSQANRIVKDVCPFIVWNCGSGYFLVYPYGVDYIVCGT